MNTVQAVANTLLKRSFEENISVTPMKLQKLIYFIYRDYYKKTGKKLFSEPFMTWKYGPVLNSIYEEFKCFGAKKITSFAKDAEGSVYIINLKKVPDAAAVIDNVWNKYKDYTGIEMSKLTHCKGTAWSVANEKGELYLNDEDIRNEPSC